MATDRVPFAFYLFIVRYYVKTLLQRHREIVFAFFVTELVVIRRPHSGLVDRPENVFLR